MAFPGANQGTIEQFGANVCGVCDQGEQGCAVAGEEVSRIGDMDEPVDSSQPRRNVEIAAEITDDVAKPAQGCAFRVGWGQRGDLGERADLVEVGSLHPAKTDCHARFAIARIARKLPPGMGGFRGAVVRAVLSPVSQRFSPGDRVVVDIDKMANGPHAVARHDGFVLFVRGAVPGERVEVRIRECKRHHAFADVVGIDRSSPQRRHTPCPIAGQCGGCPWQHLAYETQLAAKREIVAEQLSRVAGLTVDVPPVVASPRVFGYRRRIKLRVHGGRVGFYAGGTHELIDVAHCALAESEVDAMISAAQGLADELSCNVRRLEIIARHGGCAGTVLLGEVEGAWVKSDEGVCSTWLDRTQDCVGMVLHGRGWVRRWGVPEIALEPEPQISLDLEAAAFSQVNASANQRLVATLIEMLGDVSGSSILEAYAGAGNFSAPMARRGARILAVEQSPAACRSARRNAAAVACDWTIEQGAVGAVLGRLADRRASFDAIVLDPPRSGAGEAIPAMLRLAPRRIVYVSCDPATLARDLKSLSAAYQVMAIRAIDMFPHTYHVETVVRCDRR